MSTYVLVHGASQGGWCWEKAKMKLEKNGHTVFTPDLPGHEAQSTLPYSEITFDRYVQRIVDIVTDIEGKVVLVGHSLGGAVIEKAIDELDENKVAKAIFVSGFIPKDGDIVGEILKADVESELRDCFNLNEDGTAVELIPEKIGDIVYNGCRAEDVQIAKSKVVPQSVIPIGTPIRIKHRKDMRRIGIICTNDKSLTPATQERMYRAAGCELRYLESGHAPFFSHDNELTDILLEN